MHAGLYHICQMAPMRRFRKSFRLECAGDLWSYSCKFALMRPDILLIIHDCVFVFPSSQSGALPALYASLLKFMHSFIPVWVVTCATQEVTEHGEDAEQFVWMF